MEEETSMKPDNRALVSTRAMEAGVAASTFALGALIVYDAVRLGHGWADDGPRAGYFPFYIGVILCACSAVSFFQGLRASFGERAFVERGQAKQILAILLPSLAYVIAVALAGIYVTSAVFIGAFMAWKGRFAAPKCIAVGAGVSVGLFLMFEIWFKVPLPKGPLETLLGF